MSRPAPEETSPGGCAFGGSATAYIQSELAGDELADFERHLVVPGVVNGHQSSFGTLDAQSFIIDSYLGLKLHYPLLSDIW